MATRKPDRSYPEASEHACMDSGYPKASESACMDRNHPEASEGQKKELDDNIITHEAVEGRISEDCNVNEVTATNNKTSAERNVEGQTGKNVGKPSSTERTNADLSRQDMSSTEQSEVNLSRHGADSTEQSEVEKLNTFPQRMLLCSRCQAALRHKNIVRRTSVTENWTGTCSICKHLLYVGEYEVMDKTIGRTTRHESDTEISGPNHQR